MGTKKINILLIEDDPGDADILREILFEKNKDTFAVIWFDRLQKGLAYLAQDDVDVVLLDLSLPNSHGLETFTKVYAQAPHIPIVVLSGLDDETMAVEAVHAGAQDYLVKGEVEGGLLARALRYAIERKRVEETLRESEERYALAARGANDGLWDWNLKTNQIYYSPRWKTMLGHDDPLEIGSDPEEWFHRVHPDDREQLQRDINAHLAGLTPHLENEHRMFHVDGSYRWMLCRGLAVRDGQERTYRMAGSQTDITRRKRAEERLLHDALHDALTGLPNRTLFSEKLKRSIGHAKRRPNYLFAILFLDLDRFKVVNDSLGHLIGDQVLIVIARRLESSVRPGDSVARIGGDEFVILLDDVKDTDEVLSLATQLHDKVSAPINLNEQQVFSSASIGIVLSQDVLSSRLYGRPEELLRDAGTAMYQAKALGRAQFQIFEVSMRARAVALLALETQLRRAIQKQELEIYYQPIVSLATRRITGVEALLRWQHAEHGFIAPTDFIPLAEETGLIVPLGEWLLRTICEQARAWHEAGYSGLRVAVNVSMRQFRERSLPALIDQILADIGLPSQILELEITESIAMQNVEFSLATLNELSAMGLQLSIDDFGIGYSSLERLKRLPVQTLKIDQSFVKDITNDGNDATIVTAIIAMAHSLNLKIVAEGVETEEQLAFLRTEGCDEVQGYLFSKALPAETLTQLLQEEWRASMNIV